MIKKMGKLLDLGEDELRIEELRLQEQIFRLRFQLQTGNAENPSRVREVKRDLARVKTIQRERALGIRSRTGAEDASAGAQAKTEAGKRG